MAFCAGVGCQWAIEEYREATSPVAVSFLSRPELIVLTNSNPLESSITRVPGDLPEVLRRIDERYEKQCQLPTDLYGDWPTVKQLTRFRICNERWAMARREAIDEELARYMVRY